MDFGEWGVWSSFIQFDEDAAGEAAAAAEAIGFTTFWLGHSPRLAQTRLLLEGSKRQVVGTSIVNLWTNDPTDLAREFHELEADFPGRVCVGVGVGHPERTSDYKRPLASLEAFLDKVDGTPEPIPRDRRIVAALGPRMLAASGRLATGTIPYFTGVEHTRAARIAIGPDALLIPELACVIDEDVERARAKARRYAKPYLQMSNYTNALLRHGFTAADVEDGGSDRLIDHVIPHGAAAEIAAVALEHRKAGADQVCFQMIGVDGIPVAEWQALADALRLDR